VERVVGERRDNESRESTVNSRAPTGIVDRKSEWSTQFVREPFVTDDCSADGVVGNKECEILSGLVCNPYKYRQHGTVLKYVTFSSFRSVIHQSC
jgi:hypothetical protein